VNLVNTLIRARLPSGDDAVYEVQPQHLNSQHWCHGDTPGSVARAFGKQLWHSRGGRWYESGGPLRHAWHEVTDPKTLALLERLDLEL